MATALRHISECPVCLLAYDQPKVLPCDHSVCGNCTNHLKRGTRIKCPVCNATHDVAKIRADFRLDQFLDALKEKEQQAQTVPTSGEKHKCEICCDKSISFRCEDCEQWMCKDCKTLHMRTKSSKNHHVAPANKISEEIKEKFKAWDATTATELEFIGGIKGVGKASDVTLMKLVDKQFKQQKQIELENYTCALRLIMQQLWLCQGGQIQIFTLDLQLQRTLCNTDWSYVNDVTDMPSGELVIACFNGLFHITSDGETRNQIDRGLYNSVAFYDSTIYTCTYYPSTICTYKYSGSWNKLNTFKLPFSGNEFVTISVRNNNITACSVNNNKIVILSLTGEILHTIDNSPSRAYHQLSYPNLCQEDDKGSLLIADKENNRLMILDKLGNRSIVNTEPAVEHPCGAVVTDDKIYVVARGDYDYDYDHDYDYDAYTLSLFTS